MVSETYLAIGARYDEKTNATYIDESQGEVEYRFGNVSNRWIDEAEDYEIEGEIVMKLLRRNSEHVHDSITSDVLTDEIPVEAFAEMISHGSLLTERESEFWVYRNLFQLSRRRIAGVLEVSPSRVDDIRRQVDEKMEKALKTIDGTRGLLPEGSEGEELEWESGEGGDVPDGVAPSFDESPDDSCSACGRERSDLDDDEEMLIEVATPSNVEDWLCSTCRENDRGLP